MISSWRTTTMMFRELLLLSLLGLCLATAYKTEFKQEPMSDEEINYINSVQSSWTAGRNFEPNEYEKVKSLLVDIEAHERYSKLYSLPVSDVEVRDDLPKEFDSRKQWPQCKSIGEIRDQAACASSWVFGPVEAMTDRVCIHTNTSVHLSAADIISCCNYCGGGCDGGSDKFAWRYFQYEGVVTGGNNNSNEGCMPYFLPKCDHAAPTKYAPCPKMNSATPKCTFKCRNGYGKTYEQDKYHGQQAKSFTSEQQIMQEIVDNGPVSAAFIMYSDFFNYKSGVYRYTYGIIVGVHVAKIVGYGEENGQKYWLVANSWNENWGNKGFFRIAKGTDECSIEANVVAGIPKQKPNTY